MLLRMAWRNLARRPIQSLLASLAIAAGLAVAIFVTNFQWGAWSGMMQDAVVATAGHVLVQPAGYQDSKDTKLLLEGTSGIAEQLRGIDPEADVIRRVFLSALIASPNNTVAVAMTGVEPEAERSVSRMPDKIVDGGWFEKEGEKKVLIGVELAKRLQVDVGDKVVITTSSKGELQAMPARVRGIFETHRTRVDSFFAVIPLQAAQRLMPEYDDPATQVALLRDTLDVPEGLRDQVVAAVGSGPEVLEWQEALPELKKSEELDKVSGNVIWVFLGAIVSVGVLNVLLMSLFQRTRELGVMLAIGMRPKAVARLLLLEGALLGVVGAVLGVVLGWALTWPMVQWGVDLAAMANSAPIGEAAMDTLIRSEYVVPRNLAFALIFVIASALSAAWPALRAARLEAVEALRAT